MAKIKASELNDVALDWAVTLIVKPEACEYGVADWINQRLYTVKDGEYVYRWHQSWAQGGPIIEREELSISCEPDGKWHSESPSGWQYGPTALIAAMRCFVASKLGDEVEIPEELL